MREGEEEKKNKKKENTENLNVREVKEDWIDPEIIFMDNNIDLEYNLVCYFKFCFILSLNY